MVKSPGRNGNTDFKFDQLSYTPNFSRQRILIQRGIFLILAHILLVWESVDITRLDTMSTTTSPLPPTSSDVFVFDGSLDTTEWIIIVIVLIIILIALIIAVARCLELPPEEKALAIQEANSARSSFRNSPYTSPSNTMASSKGRSLNRMPLNAEITRLSAGRVSRSAQYGVVIRDINKTLPGTEAVQNSMPALPPPTSTLPPPGYDEAARYDDDDGGEIAITRQTLPDGSVRISQRRLAPPNSKAVFQAPDDDFATTFSSVTPRMTVGTTPRSIVLDPQYLHQLRY